MSVAFRQFSFFVKLSRLCNLLDSLYYHITCIFDLLVQFNLSKSFKNLFPLKIWYYLHFRRPKKVSHTIPTLAVLTAI